MNHHHIVLLHRIVVSLFLLHYIYKGFLLVTDKKDALTGYVSKTKIAEMVISLLFLLTGVYLVVTGPALSMMQVLKIVMVLASIPLAIVGFKKSNKMLAVVSVVLLLGAYGLAEMNKSKSKHATVDTSAVAGDPIAVGKTVYATQCTSCHGDAGDAMVAGAKNLKLTQMTDEKIKETIKYGVPKMGMPSFAALTDDQLAGLTAYIKTLKQ